MYKAIVAKIDEIQPIANADNIQLAKVLGYFVIVNKSQQVGDMGILFPDDGKLSAEYLKLNNLYRHEYNNEDQNKKGFFEDSGQIRALKLRGAKSDCYFAAMESLSFFGNIKNLKLGDEVQSFGGKVIAEKYVSKVNQRTSGSENNGVLRLVSPKLGFLNKLVKRYKHVSAVRNIVTAINYVTETTTKGLFPSFKEHQDSQQFRLAAENIQVGSRIIVFPKFHGTSERSGLLRKVAPLNTKQKLVNMLFRRKVYQEKLGDYEYVTGTRRVVLNEKNVRAGFHGSDSFRVEVTNSYKHALKEGMTFYGEIFGWVNATPIMGHYSTEKLGKDYFKKYGKDMVFSYGIPKDTYGTIVYRITQDVENEKPRDLMWDELEEFGKLHNLPMNKPLLVIDSYDGDSKKLREIVEALTEREGDKLTEDYVDPTHISEGVILHVEKDGQVYYIKNKAFAFKVLENIAKLEDKVDVEEQESSETADEQT